MRPTPTKGSPIMMSTAARLAAIAATISTLAVAVPMASAYAGPAGSAPAGAIASPSLVPHPPLLGPWSVGLVFVPPAVGPISTAIGPIIIGGVVISSGVHVSTPGVSLPPIYWHAGS